MSDPSVKTPPPQPLLPDDKLADRPLFVVLAILAFLATLTLLTVKLSYVSAGSWGDDLSRTVTVQIIPIMGKDTNEAAQKARSIIMAQSNIDNVSIMPKSYSEGLLKPWLGDMVLPNDLPLPILLSIKISYKKNFDVIKVSSALKNAGIKADIDDHSQWSKDLKRTARAAQTIAILAFILIMLAINGAAVFATRAAIVGRTTLMQVLQQVGALPAFTAKIFSLRCARTSLKAGAIGTLGAFLLLIVLGLFGTMPGLRNFMPGISVGLIDFLLALLIPIAMAIISAFTAWKTVNRILMAEMYP